MLNSGAGSAPAPHFLLMKTKSIFFINLVCIFHLFGQVHAQTERFSKIFCPYNIAAIGRHILVTDTGYIAGGVAKDSNSQMQTLVLLRVSKQGLLNGFKTPSSKLIKYYPGSASSIVKTKDGGYVWAGQTYNFIKACGFLIKLDSLLSTSWEREYSFNNDSTYSYLGTMQVKQTYDGGYAMTGDIDGPGQYDTDVLLLRTDSLGQKLWQKTYNFKGADRGWNLIETPDKGFLLGAGGYVAGNEQSYDGLIIKTDSAGNEQWRKTIGGSYLDYYCVVANSNDGNFLVGTIHAIGQFAPDYPISQIRLMKINSGGVVLWDKLYGKATYFNQMGQVLIQGDGNIIVSGSYLSDSSTVQYGESYGYVLKTNSQGDSVWMREYYYFNGDANANRLYDIKQTPDGGFIACGEVDSLPAIPQSIWVLKLDSFGCLVPGCQNVGMKEVILQDNEQLFVFPNPASTEINIRLPEKFRENAQQARIFDHLGREVLRQHLTAGEVTHAINIASLPTGVYYIRIIGNGISVVAGKVVKE
jgi:hypothetical protein